MHGYTRTQPSLFWQGRSQPAAQSSYEAAVVASRTADDMCARLLAYVRQQGYDGATDAESERALGWGPNVVTARRNDLIDRGQVVVRWPAARRPSVKTRPGRKPVKVTVWIATEACK